MITQPQLLWMITAWKAAAGATGDEEAVLEMALARGMSPYFTTLDSAGVPRSLAEQVAWGAPEERIEERLWMLQRAGWDPEEVPPGPSFDTQEARFLWGPDRNRLREDIRRRTNDRRSGWVPIGYEPGMGFLHLCAKMSGDWLRKRREAIGETLLQMGVDIDVPDASGKTALMHVVSWFDRDAVPVAEWLIERGADPDLRDPSASANAMTMGQLIEQSGKIDEKGRAILRAACMKRGVGEAENARRPRM